MPHHTPATPTQLASLQSHVDAARRDYRRRCDDLIRAHNALQKALEPYDLALAAAKEAREELAIIEATAGRIWQGDPAAVAAWNRPPIPKPTCDLWGPDLDPDVIDADADTDPTEEG